MLHLNTYITQQQAKGNKYGLLFPPQDKLGLQNAFTAIIKQLKRTSSKVTQLKDIRASRIVIWLQNYDLRQVQYMCGHKYVSSTEKYKVNDVSSLQDQLERFHPLG